MTDDTTTIEITTEQRERLREVNSGSAKAALADALDAYENDGQVAHVEPSVDIPPEVLAEALDASLEFPEKISEQLDRIESAASTAEERTGELQKTLDNMGANR
jgi:hypothetical protein